MIKETIAQEKNILTVLFIYAFLLIFFCSKMSPLYPINDWSDINLYFNIGKMINAGKVPYTEAFDHKGPLIFFIYGIGALISDSSFFGMYLIESIGWAIMILFAYLTARLFVDKIYAFIVALVFPVLMLSHTSQGGSAEEFIAIAQVASLYFFIRYFKDDTPVHKPKHMLIHGIMSAITLLIKINLIVFWFFPLLAIFIGLIIRKEYKNLMQNIAAYILGVMIITLPVCIYFAANNALSEAWNIYIVLNKNYATIGSFSETAESLAVRFYLRLRFETFEFLTILTGAIYFPIRHIGNKWGRIALVLSFFALYIAIFSSPKYVHYYSIPYYVYALPGCIVLCRFIRIKPVKAAYITLFILILAWGIRQREFYGLQINEMTRSVKQEGLIYQFSGIINKEKDPTLLNLGLDTGNAVFTAANIVPNVRYFISPNLPDDLYPEMRDEQTKYIEKKEIQFIILAEGSVNYDYFHNLPALNENYTIADSYLEDGYKTYYLYKRKD
ncbi:MAG: glycosyltransferase family 39 protein [Prevotella sp.]|nr:glycosyltransferase family 39 protein [Prevotella sp.]